MNEKEFNENLQKINNKVIKADIIYIDYKQSFKETLIFILKHNENKYSEKAKKKLNLFKIFKFNQSCELGENNYFFYELCLQLFDKIEELYDNYNLYTELINDLLIFLEKENFDELTNDKEYYFRYVSQVIIDEKSLNSKTQLDKIIAHLKSESVSEEGVIKSIKKMDKFQQSNNIKFKLKYDKNTRKIKFEIKENRRINKRNYFYTTINSYKINSFNKKILKKKKKNFDLNFESNLFENIISAADNQLEFYQNIKNSLDIIIKRILSSTCAKKFFSDYYVKKHKDLKYHFDRKDVQDEILKRMTFAPIFNNEDKAYTNPIDLSIVINSIPGKISGIETHSFNRKIMHVGKILVFCLHEIFGHFLRRYYSYFTGGKIPFNTKEDFDNNMDDESGFFIEYKFLGLKKKSYITLNNILRLLYSFEYSEYPIIKKEKNHKFEFDEIKLKRIIDENKDLFNFIFEKVENVNDKNEPKILLEDYLDILKVSYDKFTIVHCYKYEKNSISLI